MELFRKLLMSMNAQNKVRLTDLYEDRLTKEKEENRRRLFVYKNLQFCFSGSNYKYPEIMYFHIGIPQELIYDNCNQETILPLQHYLLKYLGRLINDYNHEHRNNNKSDRERPYVEAQVPSEVIIKRNGISYNNTKNMFVLNIYLRFPLINNHAIISKSAFNFIKDLLIVVNDECIIFNKKYDIKKALDIYNKEQQIRNYLDKFGYISFIGDGSILPREKGTINPNLTAIPFKAPKEDKVKITFSDGTTIKGMVIKKGINIITGGGYSGKTTILETIQNGVYDHEIGDGREFCITDTKTTRVSAENSRYISNVNLEVFFKYIGTSRNVKHFSTDSASGSVSQATNIIEAINANCKVLLIDEDDSATNFMIRDDNMRKIIKNEPIIPFTDRIVDIYQKLGISIILVIGGSSEYIKYSNNVYLMDEFKIKNITKQCDELIFKNNTGKEQTLKIKHSRKMIKNTNSPILYFEVNKNENNKTVIIGEYKADITNLVTLISDNQINYLAYVLKKILQKNECYDKNIYQMMPKYYDKIRYDALNETIIEATQITSIWFEEIRIYDLLFTINRLRGLTFKD